MPSDKDRLLMLASCYATGMCTMAATVYLGAPLAYCSRAATAVMIPPSGAPDLSRSAMLTAFLLCSECLIGALLLCVATMILTLGLSFRAISKFASWDYRKAQARAMLNWPLCGRWLAKQLCADHDARDVEENSDAAARREEDA